MGITPLTLRLPHDHCVKENSVNENGMNEPAAGAHNDDVVDEFGEKLRAFQAFRKSDSAASESILTALGAQDDVDKDIVLELSARRPLGHPDRFPEAHALAVRALEVLDRNGARGVRINSLGPVGPIAAFGVQQVTHLIVRSYQSTVADQMLRLYERREANTARDDPDRKLLMRARMQMERIAPGFKRNVLGVPAFFLGGAVLSGAVRILQLLLASALSTMLSKVIATVVLGMIIAALAWVILRGAAVARRRIHLTMDGPLVGLWNTIGRCGKPPRDPSRTIALIAIILTFLPWVLIPIGLFVGWITG